MSEKVRKQERNRKKKKKKWYLIIPPRMCLYCSLLRFFRMLHSGCNTETHLLYFVFTMF